MRRSLWTALIVSLVLAGAGAARAADLAPAYKKFLEIKIGSSAKDLLAQIGNPDATFDGFTYRAGESLRNLEQAVIYRFKLEGEPVEIIVGKQSGKIVRKQLSSANCFPPLPVASANVKINVGATLQEATAAVGAAPMLWIEFALPVNAAKPSEAPPVYQAYIWPDAAGQLAALVRDGKIVKAEYQPGGEALLTTPPQPLDAEHPRVPRWLLPAPNNFAVVDQLPAYKQFLEVAPGIAEAELLKKLGPPASCTEIKDSKDPRKIVQHIYMYNAKDQATGIVSSFMYHCTPAAGKDALGKDDGILTKKSIFSMGVENKMLPRHIGQGIRGMSMAQLEAIFGGKGRVHEMRINPDGKQVLTCGWGGKGAFFAMEFPEGSAIGTSTSSGSSGDKDERGSRYEEYVVRFDK